MQTITIKQVRELAASGQVVFGYPRKGVVVVNGFKRFAATPAVAKVACELAKAA